MKALTLITLCFAGTLAAQTVSPVLYTNCEAPSGNIYPFGNTQVPFRYVQVHDDVPAPMVIQAIAFRHSAATGVIPAHTITMDAWMSTATTTAGTMSTTFDSNHGLDKIQVVTNRTYNVPAYDPFELPGLFVIDYPLDVPFVYLGTGSLCWEVQVTAKTLTTQFFYDYCGSLAPTSNNPALAANRAGNGCLSTGRTAAMGLAPTSAMNWPGAMGALTLTGSNMLASGAGFLTVGFSHTLWNTIPLPAVIPTSSGAPSGTCTAYAEVLVANLVQATAAGGATFTFAFTPTTSLIGVTLYSQLWGLDLAANPFGITTSNVAMHNVVGPQTTMPVGRVWLGGSLAATGTFGSNGMVTKFR